MGNMVRAATTRLFAVCTAGFLIGANPATARHPDVLPDMTSLLAEQHVASASVAVIRDGRIVSMAAWGSAGPNRPATVATPYNLASLTKPLTAEIVLRLVSAGKFSLDEPMDRYWSDPDLSRDPRRKMLTARMALSHRTGFPNWRSGKGLVFDHDPGTTTGYSGEGYQYVARYAENRTHTPFAQLAQEWLFRPARLHTIGYVSAQGSQDPIAIGYDGGKPLPIRTVTQFNAADLAHATAGDYARFLIDVRSDRHLTPALAVERSRLQADQGPDVCGGVKAESCPPWIGFGLGWQLLGFPQGTIMMHTGRDEGAFTFAEIDRATGNGIVILTNSDQGWRLILPLLERTNADPALIRYLRAQID